MICQCSSKDLFNFGCCSKQLSVWFNGVDWVIAQSVDEARDVLKAWAGYDDDETLNADGWYQLLDDTLITIHEDGNRDNKEVLTAREWVQKIGKPCFLCSTEI